VKLPTIVELAKRPAFFERYQDGKLWYSIKWDGPNDTVPLRFEFPIPVDDAGGGEFLPTDKALTFMRWIRKHLEYLHGALAEGAYDQ
jgi:hypothetical protein